MRFLFIFLDGVGLGEADARANPFFKAKMPHLRDLLDGHMLVEGVAPLETARATLLALDANLGVPGLPQSATGQATLLTGKNTPQLVGEHYGPKPHQPVRELIAQGSVFSVMASHGKRAALLNAYPDGYFEHINSGLRMYSAIPLAVTQAGIQLKTAQDLHAGDAISADFTGKGWREHFKDNGAVIYNPHAAGVHLARLAFQYDFAFFEYWLSDFAGHKQDMPNAVEQLATFDGVLGGLLENWEDEQGLILVTSDHGNMENLDTRRHTDNPVPGLVIGAPDLRHTFCRDLHDLAGVAPAILRLFDLPEKA